MAAVTVRNIPVKTHEALKRRAKQHGKSTEAEIRLILEEAVRPKEAGFGTELREIARKHGAWFDDVKRDPTPLEPADFG